MLADTHIRLLHDYLDSHECFPTVAIEGGVCYFRWDKDCIDKCKFISHSNGVVNVTERYLSENSSGIVIRDAGSLSILEKTKSEDNFSKLVSPRNLFKVEIEKLREQEKENGIKVFGRYNRGRGNQFLDNYITKDIRAERFLGKWKVFVSKADGAAGQLGNPIPARIIGKAELGDPFTICTETFLAVGPFNSRQETVNVMKYFTTKFFRFLVGVRKLKNMTQDTYSFVPIQNFCADSDIDWTKSIAEIDKQLYIKYGLSPEEIRFIETMIAPM